MTPHNLQTKDHPMWKTPDSYLDVTDATLPYWKVGQGPDLVFVHGWPLDSQTWRHAVEDLSSSFTCHLFDLPGAGLSRWSDDGDFSLEGLSRAAEEVIGQLDLPELGLVAHDSGGTIARMAAANLSDRLRGVALGNTEIPGHHPWRLAFMLRMVRMRGLHGVWSRVMRSPMGRRALLHDSIANTSLIESELAPRFIDPLTSDARRFEGALLLPTHVDVADFDVVGLAHPQIVAPVHLIWGRDDPYFLVKKAEAMLSEFGGEASMTILDDAKLLVHEEHPALFNAEVRAHFESCFGGSSERTRTPPIAS